MSGRGGAYVVFEWGADGGTATLRAVVDVVPRVGEVVVVEGVARRVELVRHHLEVARVGDGTVGVPGDVHVRLD